MAQAGQAPATSGPRLNINIDAQYNPNVSHGSVDNGGQVYFDCAPVGGARVYTSPAGAFTGETNGYLALSNGNNGPFTPSGDNFTITYCCCAPTSSCSPVQTTETGGYTIQVGNPPESEGEDE